MCVCVWEGGSLLTAFPRIAGIGSLEASVLYLCCSLPIITLVYVAK